MILYNDDASKIVVEIASEFHRVNVRKHTRTITVRGMKITFDSTPAASFVRFATDRNGVFKKDGTLIMCVYDKIFASSRAHEAKEFNIDPRIIQGPLIAARVAHNGNSLLYCHNFNRKLDKIDGIVHTIISTGGDIKILAFGEVIPKDKLKEVL